MTPLFSRTERCTVTDMSLIDMSPVNSFEASAIICCAIGTLVII